MKRFPKPRHIRYAGAPFVEEFIERYGTGDPDLMVYASACYRQRGSRSIPMWEDYCYLPVNVAVGYCEYHGADDHSAAFTAKLLASAQAIEPVAHVERNVIADIGRGNFVVVR